MRYKFIKRGETPSSSDLVRLKDFDKVLSQSKNMVGATLTSNAIKGVLSLKGVIVVLLTTLILVCSSYVIYKEVYFNEPALSELPIENLTSIDSPSNINSSLPRVPSKGTREAPGQPDSVDFRRNDSEAEKQPLLLYEDVVVYAVPLPNKETFMAFIDKELKYPDSALKDSTQGYVDVRFRVNKKGEVDDFKISKSLGEIFDNEAIRVIRSYKKWQPATYNGEAIDSFLKLRITFNIQSIKPF